jgi:hypothetical protein
MKIHEKSYKKKKTPSILRRILNYVVYLVIAVVLLAESVQRLEPSVVSGRFRGFDRRRHPSVSGRRAIPVLILC